VIKLSLNLESLQDAIDKQIQLVLRPQLNQEDKANASTTLNNLLNIRESFFTPEQETINTNEAPGQQEKSNNLPLILGGLALALII